MERTIELAEWLICHIQRRLSLAATRWTRLARLQVAKSHPCNLMSTSRRQRCVEHWSGAGKIRHAPAPKTPRVSRNKWKSCPCGLHIPCAAHPHQEWGNGYSIPAQRRNCHGMSSKDASMGISKYPVSSASIGHELPNDKPNTLRDGSVPFPTFSFRSSQRAHVPKASYIGSYPFYSFILTC